ncbi:MAG: TolB family protein, partial [Gemmatimonadales bacterium]
MRSILARVVAAAVLASSAVAAQSSGRAFNPEDWYKIARVGGGALSPDGNTLAFTVTTVIEDKNARHTEVWIQPVAGGTARRMTAPAFESTAPRWSDDGKTLYFTSTRPGSRGTSWAIRMDEGGEAFPAEGAAAGGPAAGGRGGGRGGRGGNVAAQPADKSFTITAGSGAAAGGRAGAAGGRGGRGGRGDVAESTTVSNDPYAKMGPLARPPQGSITKPHNPARFDGRHFIDERTRSNDAGFLASSGRGNAVADSLAALMGGGRGGRGAFLPPLGTPPVQLFIQRGTGERKAITSTNYT